MGTKIGAMAGTGVGAALMAVVMTAATPAVQKSEGTVYSPYHDQVGVLTVCTGHTGRDIVVNKVYSPADCKALTDKDLEVAAQGVLKTSPQLIYHPIVLASAVSFSYNVGVGAYSDSSVARDFNAGNLVKGCKDLLKYDIAGGRINEGLQNRRAREEALCLSTLTPKGLANAPNPGPA